MMITYTKPDGTTRTCHPTPEAIAMLMSEKPAMTPELVAHSLHILVTVEKRDPGPMMAFYNGMVTGGLSERAAIEAIAAKDSLPGETWEIA